MPTITSPLVETQPVVTGTMYQITIAEETNGTGITRIDIGPYHFDGTPPQIKYPEAPTIELNPRDFRALGWVTDPDGSTFLRFDGGRILPEDGDTVFQFTSNYPPKAGVGPVITVYHGGRSEDFRVPCPDYTQRPPERNSRHDSVGLGRVYKQTGCLPQTILAGILIASAVAWFVR